MSNIQWGPDDLQPQSTRHFYRSRLDPSTGFDVTTLIHPAAVAAIGDTFMSANLANEAWQYGEAEGRLDSRRAWRYKAMGDMDIFKDRRAPSASSVRVIVLVDASGSMHGGCKTINAQGEEVLMDRTEASAIFAATLVAGLTVIPTVKVEVIQHDFGYGSKMGSRVHTVNLRRAWDEGTPLSFMNKMPNWMPGGGNADGHAIMAIAEYLKVDLLPGEVPMIIVISDGAPADVGKNPNHTEIAEKYGATMRYDEAGAALREGVANARRDGNIVLSVAIAGGEQGLYYGSDNVVRFTGDWVALATSLAAKVGEQVATAYQRGEEDPFAY